MRLNLARKLFLEWTGVTDHPDLQAALWANLSPVDRQHWIALADKQLSEGEQ